MATIQQKLKFQMEKSQLKPHSLAKVAGVPESSIKNIIYGKSHKPRLELLELLADKLSCAVTELLSDNDPRAEVLAQKQGQNEYWDGALYIMALQTVLDLAQQEQIVLSQKKATQYAERVYQYALANEDTSIDQKFARYIVLFGE